MPPPDSIDAILKLVGFLTVLVSFLTYRHQRQQRRDSWLRDFRELHKRFWNEEALADVRAWLANEQAYLEIRPILLARRAVEERRMAPEDFPRDDYSVLEKIDKFCNLMTSVQLLDPHFSDHRELWQRLFVDYWVDRIRCVQRQELGWYVEKFYPELVLNWKAPGYLRRILSGF